MLRLRALLLVPFTALVAAACSGTAASPVLAGCTAGASEACVCAGSTEPGIQVCGTDGMFTACICAPTQTSHDGGADGRVDGGVDGGPDGNVTRHDAGVDANPGDAMQVYLPDAQGTDVLIAPVDASVCASGELACNGQTPESCVGGQWVSSGAACTGGTPDCENGVCGCPVTTCGNECVDTTTDPAHCGSCTTSCAYTCTASVCGPLEVEADTGPLGFGIATDGTEVYWLSNETGAALEACPISGCPATPQTIASNINPTGQFGNMLAVSAASIYWADAANVMVAPLSGTSTAIFATTTGPEQLVTDSNNVYWTDSSGFIYECALGSSCASPTILVDATAAPDGGVAVTLQELAVDATYVYWSDTGGNISSHPLRGGATVLIAAGASPYDLVALAGEVYWTGDAGVYRCAANVACAPSPYYAEAISAFGNLAINATTLYWTTGNSPSGAVRKCALGATCATPTTFVNGVDTPSYIVVDAVHSYWLQGMSVGTVYEYSE